MNKKSKNIGFNKRFRYEKEKSEYTFQLKKRNWWWLLFLLLLPLLLMLKCECKRENPEPVIVHVIDRDTKDDIANASVHWTVKPALISKTHECVTDINGRDTLDDVTRNDKIIMTVTAKAEGYVDTTYTYICIPKDLDPDGSITIKMRPESEDFHADIVMCIDNTGSMGSLLNMVKRNALNFHSDLKNYCARKGQSINEIRVKVIAFGDFADSNYTESGLLRIPDQTDTFHQFVENIGMTGGGDGPEDGLEALALAINSSWNKKSTRRRHIILLYTDAPPHPLGTSASSPNYPENMPRSMGELTKMWDGMDTKSRRLVLFAPNQETWNYIDKTWNNVIHEEKNLNEVLSGHGYEKVLEVISKSL